MATALFLALSSSAAARPKARRAAPSRVAAAASASGEPARRLVAEFDPAIPLASAVTPPSGWYTDPGFLRLELDRVFLRGWQAVGHIGQVKNPNDFFTGSLGNVEFVICRDANGKLQAFHNVCRHHASLLACGSGQKTCFQCPYHTGLLKTTSSVSPEVLFKKFLNRLLMLRRPDDMGAVRLEYSLTGGTGTVDLSANSADANLSTYGSLMCYITG